MPELHPRFVEEMSALLENELGDFLRALEEAPALAMRVNPRREGALACAQPYVEAPVPWAEHGFYLRPGARPGAGALHMAGAFYIQEASAMLPAAALGARPGEKILDLCAAPGGKSSQIAFALNGEGLLVANEPEPKRAKMLAGNLERLGVPNALVVNEYPDRLSAKWPEFFDAVLVDAPCSGEGMFRREVDSRLEWNPASPEGCAKRQKTILDHAARMLRPGGRMVYSTCTYNRQENEDMIAWFLETHPEFSLTPFALPGLPACEGMLKIFPHRVRGDGQFAALLTKAGIPSAERPRPAARKRPAKRGEADPEALFDRFQREFGVNLPGYRPILWADALCAVPEGAPDVDGIKTVSPGVELARISGSQLKPAHQSAMTFPGLPCTDLDDPSALAYLRGEEVPCGQTGWLVARWNSMPLGWGKASGGTLKNHLPKGLRRSLDSLR